MRKGTIAILMVAVFLFGLRAAYVALRYPEHPHGAAQSRSAVERHALNIGLTLAGSVRLVMPAEMHAQREYAPGGSYRVNKVWVVLCEAGDQQLNLLFDDNTGRLTCLVMDISPSAHGKDDYRLPVHTMQQAISVGAARLRSLQMLPAGAEVALRERPQPSEKAETWTENWLVRSPSYPIPHTIKMTLERESGKPVCMVDVIPNYGSDR